MSGEWCRPVRSNVAHYFRAGHTRCVCGNYVSRNREADPGDLRCRKCEQGVRAQRQRNG